MKNIIKYLTVTLSVLLGFVQAASASESEQVDTGKVVAQLVSSHYRASPGQTIDVALRTVLDEHWHTYWRNPGDSGEAVQISWSLPEGAPRQKKYRLVLPIYQRAVLKRRSFFHINKVLSCPPHHKRSVLAQMA